MCLINNINSGKWLICLALGILAQGCCRPDVGIETAAGNPCGYARHYEKDKGCVCNAGTKMFWGDCRHVTFDTYYGKVEDSCYCFTDALLDAHRESQSTNSYSVNINYSDFVGVSSHVGYYFKKPDGDSIAIWSGISACWSNPSKKPGQAMIAGKFRGSDTLDAWVVWFYDIYPFDHNKIDSCHITFVKVK